MANLIRRRSPSPLSRVWRDTNIDPLEQLFEDFLSSSALGPMPRVATRTFVPSLELTETSNEYVMNAELPGMTENDVQLEVDDNNCLTIRGEKKSEINESRGGYDYSERSYGQFTRTVQLPSGVDASKIEANFQNGVLELHVPKSAQANVRAIPIGKSKGESGQLGAGSAQKSEGGDGSKVQEKRSQQPVNR